MKRRGLAHTEATKVKIREAALQQWQDPEHRRRVSQALMGHPVSAETREKLRNARLGVPQTPETIRKKLATALAKPSISVTCENCGILFEARRVTRRFCSRYCSAFFARWNNIPNVTCGGCGAAFFVYPYRLKKRKTHYCSYECMGRGYKSDAHNPRDANALKRWRRDVKKRDSHQCRICLGKKPLIAHHILPYQYFPELIYDLDNGMTVCKSHHQKIHRRTDELVAEIVQQQKEWLSNQLLKEVAKCV